MDKPLRETPQAKIEIGNRWYMGKYFCPMQWGRLFNLNDNQGLPKCI